MSAPKTRMVLRNGMMEPARQYWLTDAEIHLARSAHDLEETCKALLLLAMDCQQRWSRGHAEVVEAARAALEKAGGR